jgi:hypothetical protein
MGYTKTTLLSDWLGSPWLGPIAKQDELEFADTTYFIHNICQLIRRGDGKEHFM